MGSPPSNPCRSCFSPGSCRAAHRSLVSIYLLVYARIEMIPLTDSLRWKNVWASTRDAVWALFARSVILGASMAAIFTPTEAAGIACVYAISSRASSIARCLARAVANRDRLRPGDIADPHHRLGGRAYSWLVTTSGFPTRLVDVIAGFHLDTWLLLMVINVVLLFVGTVLEPPARPHPDAPADPAPLPRPAWTRFIRHHLHREPAVGNVRAAVRAEPVCTHALFGMPTWQALPRGVPFIAIYLIALALITYILRSPGPLRLWR